MKAIAAVLLTALAQGQSVQVNFLAQDVIEKRLGAHTTKNATREPALKTLFGEVGCKEDALSEQTVKGVKAPNLICTLKGASDSTIIVGAHFDLVEKGHGVVDNWSGASLLPSLYQGLAETGRKHTFVFVSFTGEEQGLLGSQFFVKHLEDHATQVRAMVNIDTLGLGQPQIWLNHSDRELANWLGSIARQLKVPLGVVNFEKVGTTDSEPFRQKKIPVLAVHSITQDTMHILHSPADKLQAIHLNDYYQTYKLLMAYLAALDQKLD